VLISLNGNLQDQTFINSDFYNINFRIQ